MRLVSADHKKAWRAQLLSPCILTRRPHQFKLRFPLSVYPAGKSAVTITALNIRRCFLDVGEQWTRDQFIEAGLPHRDLPADNQISCSVSEAGLAKLLAERRKLGPMSAWDWKIYNNIAEWTLRGVPDNAHPVRPANSRHILSSQELTLVIDKIARFITDGFVYGPVTRTDWPASNGDLHCISTFVRYQSKHINNFTSPSILIF